MKKFNKKALSLFLALMMTVSLASGAAVTAAAADTALTIYTQTGASGTPTAVKTYSDAQLKALAQEGLCGYQFYKNDTWQAVVATQYVTLDTLLDDAGVAFTPGCSLAATASDGFSQTASYETLQAHKYYFENAENALEVPAAVALKHGSGSLADGTLEKIGETATDTGSYRFVYGTTAELYAGTTAAGKRLVSKVTSLTVITPVTLSDVPGNAWYATYVNDLVNAGIIGGYDDGTFRPDATVSYGMALKLIMLAAKYSAQAPTDSNWASGYLAKALADGLLPASVDLDAPITRLEIARLAAKALKLTTTLTASPFTDTSDPAVLALSEAGIVQGGGDGKYHPGDYIDRASISAIIWRINNLK